MDPRDATIRELRSEVAALETKLGDLHTTDVVALRRALRTATQHVHALEEEAGGFQDELMGLQSTLWLPDHATAGAAKTVVTALLASLGALLLKPKPGSSKSGGSTTLLQAAPWVLGGAYLAGELARGTGARLLSMLDNNRRRKKALLLQWSTIASRIEIMSALAPAEGAGGGDVGGNEAVPGEEDDFVSISMPQRNPEPLAQSRDHIGV